MPKAALLNDLGSNSHYSSQRITMNRSRKSLFSLVLGLMTCLMVVGLSTPSIGKSASNRLVPAAVASLPTNAAIAPSSEAIAPQLASHLQDAETVLLAQAEPTPAPMPTDTAPMPTDTAPMPGASMPGTTIVRYVAVMTGNGVAPSPASTYAFGAAGAALMGNRLVIRGDFSGLSSPLRDFAADPVSPPNPNVNSGIHVHRGEPGKNGPFQYALTVQPGADQLSGRFMGEYTLTEEQLQALSNGTLYMDLHTKQNRGGELRGIFKAY
jgi:CHRD domain